MLENQVKAMIGEAEGIWSSAGKFTWKKSKDRPVTDWETAAAGMLALLPDAGKTIVEANTKNKGGTRTFRYSPAR